MRKNKLYIIIGVRGVCRLNVAQLTALVCGVPVSDALARAKSLIQKCLIMR